MRDERDKVESRVINKIDPVSEMTGLKPNDETLVEATEWILQSQIGAILILMKSSFENLGLCLASSLGGTTLADQRGGSLGHID